MSNKEQNHNFYKIESSEISEKDIMKNTISFLCSSCSKRIVQQFCKLKNIKDFSLISEKELLRECREILPNNPKIIFNILNNIRTHKNKYLIIGTALDFYSEAVNEYRYGIQEKLYFTNVQDILWGTKQEQLNNFSLIHFCIIQDIFNNEDLFIRKYNKICKIEHDKLYEDFRSEKYNKEFDKYCDKKFSTKFKENSEISKEEAIQNHRKDWLYQFNKKCKNEFEKKHQENYYFTPNNFNMLDILSNYIPFAIWTLSIDISDSVSINEQYKYDNLIPDTVWIKAINYLLCNKNYVEEFKEILSDFYSKTYSFQELDSTLINELIVPKIIPLLIKYFPNENSLGHRVKYLIKGDIHLKSLKSKIDLFVITTATHKYIKALIETQEKLFTDIQFLN